MERPPGPRRKSTASDAEDVHSKTKASRKTFVVGGAAKNHHRVPSYGKKLNQLGKLTALTSTTDQKPADDAGPSHNSPRRASIHRSHSQKSLTEHKVSKRTGSSQNLVKLRRSSSHHGSTARLAALKPMTKVAETASKAETIETNSDAQDGQSKEPSAVTNKRATFVIEDEDDDTDDVASSFANKVFMHEKREPDQRQDEKETKGTTSSQADAQAATKRSEVDDHKTSQEDLRQASDGPHMRKSNRSASNPANFLLDQKKPVDPQLSTDSVVSKDIQSKNRPQTGHTTPINSQPLTSRFLESPRKDSLPSALHMSSTYNLKDGEHTPQVNGASAPKSTLHSIYHSPHGSTTNLGIGASRTQQKLLLQRASSIRDLDGEIEDRESAKNNAFVHPRAQKEFDRISREYKNAKRFRDPLKELSLRLYTRGLVLPQNQPLRRTMTHMALNGYANDLRAPKHSQSSTNLRQPSSASMAKTPGGADVSRMLKLMWLKDDHIPSLEE